MKVKSSIERGAEYLCVKLGEVVTAIEQIGIVKGLPDVGSRAADQRRKQKTHHCLGALH